MVRIKRDGKEVRLELDVHIPRVGTQTFYFQWNCNDNTYAGLLSERMDDAMGNALKKIREEAYQQGWKDAKAKRKKEAWFSRWWP